MLNTGPIWVENNISNHCAKCREEFNLVRRKHHCRACGRLFCDSCSTNTSPLPIIGFNDPVRICDLCTENRVYYGSSNISSNNNDSFIPDYYLFEKHDLRLNSSFPYQFSQDPCYIWENNKDRKSCYNCDKPFMFFRNKYHCYNCGRIFCNRCLPYRTTLRIYGLTNRKYPVCRSCYYEKVSKKSNLIHLPINIIVQTLSYLPLTSICKMSMVCKSFYYIISSDSVDKELFQQYIMPSEDPTFSKYNYEDLYGRKYYNKYIIQGSLRSLDKCLLFITSPSIVVRERAFLSIIDKVQNEPNSQNYLRSSKFIENLIQLLQLLLNDFIKYNYFRKNSLMGLSESLLKIFYHFSLNDIDNITCLTHYNIVDTLLHFINYMPIYDNQYRGLREQCILILRNIVNVNASALSNNYDIAVPIILPLLLLNKSDVPLQICTILSKISIANQDIQDKIRICNGLYFLDVALNYGANYDILDCVQSILRDNPANLKEFCSFEHARAKIVEIFLQTNTQELLTICIYLLDVMMTQKGEFPEFTRQRKSIALKLTSLLPKLNSYNSLYNILYLLFDPEVISMNESDQNKIYKNAIDIIHQSRTDSPKYDKTIEINLQIIGKFSQLESYSQRLNCDLKLDLDLYANIYGDLVNDVRNCLHSH